MKKSSIKNILNLIVAAIALVVVFTVFAAWTFCAFPSAKAEIAGNDCEFDDRFADDKIVAVMNDNAVKSAQTYIAI